MARECVIISAVMLKRLADVGADFSNCDMRYYPSMSAGSIPLKIINGEFIYGSETIPEI